VRPSLRGSHGVRRLGIGPRLTCRDARIESRILEVKRGLSKLGGAALIVVCLGLLLAACSNYAVAF
jgi:hypothetical protein